MGGAAGQGIDPAVLAHFCRQIKRAVDVGIELGVVLGGGNLFRGAALSEAGMDRVVGDRMGMLATIMNALALGDFLTRKAWPIRFIPRPASPVSRHRMSVIKP